MVSLGGLPLSMTTHTICITTSGAPGPSFEAAQEAGLCLSDGIAAQHGKRLICTPDVRLTLSAAFHGSGVAGAAATQSRVPLCVGFCPAVAERFGLMGKLNPFDAAGNPRFTFRLYCDSPHGLHISAPHAAGLRAGVAELLAQMKRADGGLINALDVTSGVDDGEDGGEAAAATLRVVCISDTHSLHEDLGELPGGDVLIHCGDFTNNGTAAEIAAFDAWMNRQPFREKLVVAGNHDWGIFKALELTGTQTKIKMKKTKTKTKTKPKNKKTETKKKKTETKKKTDAGHRPQLSSCTVLDGTSVDINGVRFFGSGWNFRKAGQPRLIPTGTHVLITHSPPADILSDGMSGCHFLRTEVEAYLAASDAPLLHLCGHCHAFGGQTETHGKWMCVNAASIAHAMGPSKAISRPPLVFDVAVKAVTREMVVTAVANIDLDSSSSSSSAAADDDSVSTPPPSNKWDRHWGRDALPPWDTDAASNALLDLLGSLSAEFARSAAIDVGCGSGRNALALAQAGFADVVGVDIAEGALECARRNDVEGRVDWRRESVFDLLETSPIHRGRYSLVFDRQVFHDLRFVDEAKVMRTLVGLVSPAGGLLLLILGASEHSREVEARPEGPPQIGPPLVDRAELDEIIARFIAFDPSLDLRVALCRMSSFDATPTQSADAESPKCWIVGLRSGDDGLRR